MPGNATKEFRSSRRGRNGAVNGLSECVCGESLAENSEGCRAGKFLPLCLALATLVRPLVLTARHVSVSDMSHNLSTPYSQAIQQPCTNMRPLRTAPPGRPHLYLELSTYEYYPVPYLSIYIYMEIYIYPPPVQVIIFK